MPYKAGGGLASWDSLAWGVPAPSPGPKVTNYRNCNLLVRLWFRSDSKYLLLFSLNYVCLRIKSNGILFNSPLSNSMCLM